MLLSEAQIAAPSMETVACNLCGSREQRLVYRMPDPLQPSGQWFSVVRCESCGLGFVNPRPPFSEMHRFYRPEYYQSFAEQRAHLMHRYRAQAALVERFSPERRGKLLDVGCANGDFPRFMAARGWQVEGVEVSPAAHPISDFPVYHVEFPHIPAGRRYDAVTAWAVLEHVHDPLSYFRKAAAILKPGGIFVFLVTNFDSISSASLFREDVPRHLYFFTQGTTREYLRLSGLELAHGDCSDRYFSMVAHNWLRFLLLRRRGQPFTYDDAQFCRTRFLESRGEAITWKNSLRFFCRNPEIIADRLLRRLFEKAQMWRGTYGILTFVARKPLSASPEEPHDT